MPGLLLALAMGALGVTFVIAQVLGFREFLLVSQGNELSIGIVLSIWLAAAALGCAIAARGSDRSQRPLEVFVLLQVLASAVLPLALVLIRTSRQIGGSSSWEAADLLQIMWTSLLLLGPVAALGGALFTYGCRLLVQADRNGGAGVAYMSEALGGVIGGGLFSLWWIDRLEPIEIALSVGILCLLSSMLLLTLDPSASRCGSRRSLICLASGSLVVLSGAWISPVADRIHTWATRVRWSPLELVESTESVYGNITVLRLDGQTTFAQNGIPSISTPVPNWAGIEERVHLPLLALEDPKDVLMVGGGLGGGLAEALKHPLQSLVYVELDPKLIRAVEKHGGPLVESELGDPRTRVVYQDGRFFVRESRERFDAILVLLPDPSTLQLNRFFTVEFFQAARAHLKAGGIFAFSLPGSSSYLGREALLVNRCVRDSLARAFPFVRILPGERNAFLASADRELSTLAPPLLADRIEARRLELRALGPASLSYLMDPLREQWIQEGLESIGAGAARVNRDFFPILTRHFTALQQAELRSRPGERLLLPEGLASKAALAGAAVLSVALLSWMLVRKGRRGPALSFAIFTSGLAGMAVEMVGLLSFQSVCGYLYHWLGLLVAGFMAGLAVGAEAMNRRLEDMRAAGRGYGIFVLLETAQIGYLLLLAAAVILLQQGFLESQAASVVGRAAFAGVLFMAGALVGSEFPLAHQESAGREPAPGSGRAGRLYGLDLAGACIGTALVGVFLVPVMGVVRVLLLTAGLKGLSLLLLGRAR
ncbi:MAG: hypothetical protein AB1640_14435 [bacterium]